MKPDVRRVLIEQARAIPEDDVAILLSGGVDSASVLFALLEVGKRVRAYCFTFEHYASTDFCGAQRITNRFGVPLVTVFLPRSLDVLKRDLVRLVREFNATRKTTIECVWPMLYAYPSILERVVAMGMGADAHFVNSKRGMMHFRNRPDEFRRARYENPEWCQRPQHARLCALYDKRVFDPYESEVMRGEFLGTTWDEVNKPREKQSILDAFPEQFSKIKIRPHTNLQLGDSGISEHFAKLLQSDWNAKLGMRSVVGIYNALTRGSIP